MDTGILTTILESISSFAGVFRDMKAESISAAADVIAAIAALGTLFFVREWRRQGCAESQAEAARRALAAFLSFADGMLERAAAPYVLQSREALLSEAVERRWQAFHETEQEFRQARALVEQQLDNDQTEAVFELAWCLHMIITCSQRAYSLHFDYGPAVSCALDPVVEGQKLLVDGFGEDRRRHVQHLRKCAKRLLKPVIQLRSPPRL